MGALVLTARKISSSTLRWAIASAALFAPLGVGAPVHEEDDSTRSKYRKARELYAVYNNNITRG